MHGAGLPRFQPRPAMKKLSFVIVVLLLLAALYYEDGRRREMAAEVAKSAKAQESLTRRLEDLNRRVVQAERQAVANPAGVPSGGGGAAAAPAVAPAPPAPVPGVTTTAPAGWFKNGSNTKDYVVGVDQNQSLNGLPSAYVKSSVASPEGFGGMMQSSSVGDYAGKRIRYSAWVRTEDVGDGGGHLWLRIDGEQSGQMLGFDNMGNRPVKGTTEWRQESIVLDVPADSRSLNFGFFVAGPGQMWTNNGKIEEVGQDVPTTNLLGAQAKPPPPKNLNFSE